MEQSVAPAGEADAGLRAFDVCFEATALPAMLIDLGRREIIRVNAAALEVLGLPEEAVVGRPGSDFFTEVREEQVPRARALRGLRTTALREIRTSSGPRIVEMHMTPTGVGDVAFVQAVDRTPAFRAASAADEHAEELARTSELLATIGGRLAHDLRAPLTVIAGFAALLREGHELSVEQADTMLARIESSAHSLESLIEVILQDAQLGFDDAPHTSFAVADLLELVRGATDAQLAQAGGELHVTSDVGELPVRVGSLLQPVLNLVSNSIKYRSPDRPVDVRVDVRAVDDGVEIEVSDNGLGLGADPATLFDAGTRGVSAGGTVGSGLGLSFVKASVEALGGTVTTIDRDRGALVRLAVPRPAESDGSNLVLDAESAMVDTQMHQILEAAPIPTVVIDLERREILRANDAMVALIGLPRNRIVGQPGRSFLDDAAVADALRDAAMAAPGSFSASTAGLRTATAVVPVRVWLASVPDSVLAVAQVLPDESTAAAHSELALATAAMAAAARSNADELGVAGLAESLARIERLARSLR